MAKKVILDVDPGIDDAIALTIALFAPELEVTAVTAVGGNVSPAIATRNLQALIYYLDPPRFPRLGAATPPEYGLPIVGRFPSRVDELREAELKPVELRTPHPAEKVIIDEIRSSPNDVTLIALGPLTNIARAFQLDPQLPSLIHHLVIAGGTVVAPGNITPAAEFNFYCDPQAARTVLASPAAKTLVTLDATNRLSFTYGMLHDLPSPETRVGALLHKILPAKFRAYRQQLGQEAIHLHDTVAL
ncbi:MAG: nucleoside hydrolase, partial [Planctomycetota bacterium]